MQLILLISALLLVPLAAVLLWSLRGRRIDDHPLCRACGFDLTGKPESSDRCPECGNDLARPGSIRIGHREPRRVWAGFSAVLLLAASTVLIVGVVLFVRSNDLSAYKPVWWLQREALSINQPTRAAAIDELLRRVSVGDGFRLDSLADRILAIQSDTEKPWDPLWGSLMETLGERRLLDDARWHAYLLGQFNVNAVARWHVRPGDELPVRMTFDSRAARTGSPLRTFVFTLRLEHSGDLANAYPKLLQTHSMIPRSFGTYADTLSPETLQPPPKPGRYNLVLTARLDLRQPTGAPISPESLDQLPSLASRTIEFRQTVEVSETSPQTAINHPDLATFLTEHLYVGPRSRNWLRLVLQERPPVLLAYDLYWLTPSGPVSTGTRLVIPPSDTESRSGMRIIARNPVLATGRDSVSIETTPLLLVPSGDAARTLPEIFDYDSQVFRATPRVTPSGEVRFTVTPTTLPATLPAAQ